MMSIYQVLQSTGLRCVYSHFKARSDGELVEPPYLTYIGSGQNTADADDTHYWLENTYQIEYYFTKKDESNEAAIEEALLANGYNYTKSEDVYIEDEGVFVIYYQV